MLQNCEDLYEAHVTELCNHERITKSRKSLYIQQLCMRQICVFIMAWLASITCTRNHKLQGQRQTDTIVHIRAVCVSVNGIPTLCVVCPKHLFLTAWLYSGIISTLVGD
jgi:hypothetical protein